jgi:hypothetical protein
MRSSFSAFSHLHFSALFAYTTCVFFAVHRILKGNLAPGGAVAKITGKEGLEFTGKARTFDTEDAFVEAVEKGEFKKGEKVVAVLRYLGPKGGPGESIPRDIAFSTLRLLPAWGLDSEIIRFLGGYDKNVSLRPMPFPDTLACFLISVLRRSFPLSFCAFFRRIFRPQPRQLVFSHSVEGDEHD